MTSVRATMAAVGLAALVAASCGDGKTNAPSNEAARGNANATAAANANVAPPAADTKRPSEVQGDELAQGAQIYEANCASCHLKSGKGDPHHKKDDIPDFTNAAWQNREPDAELHNSIVNGHGKVMPAFKGKLTDEQVNLVLAYIRGFPTRPAAAEATEPAPKDAHGASHT